MVAGAKIAIVVPAYQEGRLIGRTLAGLPDYVDIVVVVDDASSDTTATVARCSGDPRIGVVVHPENRGVGAAIVTGYRRALDQGADVLAVMAGDNQMHPDDLVGVLRPVLDRTADYAKGNRLLHPDARTMPWARRSAGRVLAALTRLATGLDIGDSQCGYTALSASAARQLPLEGLWPRYGYPNDLLGLLAAHGMRVAEVPVRPVYADESSGVRPWHALVVAYVIVRRWALTRLGT
ncbi:MAG: glycosyltransferase family 2 protein [Polyangiaceae bacterium]|nr:glycosyltransferase family 2 protein [Polyangiaceae bacterium]